MRKKWQIFLSNTDNIWVFRRDQPSPILPSFNTHLIRQLISAVS